MGSVDGNFLYNYEVNSKSTIEPQRPIENFYAFLKGQS